MVVDHDDFVRMAVPLLGEDADRGRPAADPHALFLDAIDDGRLVCRDDQFGAAVDFELDRFLVAQRH